MPLPEVSSAASKPIAVRRGRVHVWWVDLDRHRESARSLERALGPEELAMASGMRYLRDRERYIIAHGALRSIIGSYLSTSPAGLRLRYDACGRPELATGEVELSISHSSDLFAVALTRGAPIGIDVERVRTDVEMHWLSCFSPEGHRTLVSVPECDRPGAFFRGWTRMEATLKAARVELESALRIFDLFLRAEPARLPVSAHDPAGAGVWFCRSVRPRSGYLAAVAFDRASTIRSFWWRPAPGGRRSPPNGQRCESGRPPETRRAEVVA
jgi:4'-phosphopantetheinyl transferase